MKFLRSSYAPTPQMVDRFVTDTSGGDEGEQENRISRPYGSRLYPVSWTNSSSQCTDAPFPEQQTIER